jgi:hypothetical protein
MFFAKEDELAIHTGDVGGDILQASWDTTLHGFGT